MADLILLHTAADAEWAVAFADRWRAGRIIRVAVGPSGERLAVGRHAVVAGLITPATHDEGAFSAIVGLLADRRRSAFLIADGVAIPPQPVIDANIPVVFAALSDAADMGKLKRVVQLLERGHWVTTEYRVETSAADAPAVTAAPRRKSQWRAQRAARKAEIQRAQPQTADYRPVRRVRRIGYVIGGLLGVAVVVAGFAPWAASVARRQSQERAEAAERAEAVRAALTAEAPGTATPQPETESAPNLDAAAPAPTASTDPANEM